MGSSIGQVVRNKALIALMCSTCGAPEAIKQSKDQLSWCRAGVMLLFCFTDGETEGQKGMSHGRAVSHQHGWKPGCIMT